MFLGQRGIQRCGGWVRGGAECELGGGEGGHRKGGGAGGG